MPGGTRESQGGKTDTTSVRSTKGCRMLVDFTETQRPLQQTMRRLARQDSATRRGDGSSGMLR